MDNYINNFNNFDKIIIYDFKLKDGGIGDYIKYLMRILLKCINNNTRFYCKKNNLEIEKYIKLKYNFFYITPDEISKHKDVSIETPYKYYTNKRITDIYNMNMSLNEKDMFNINIPLNEVFYFDNDIKINVNNILPSLPTNYISIHLRMGDKYLETDKKYVLCVNDMRQFSEENIYKFIEDNSDKNIIFFCDNKSYKLKIKNKYNNIIITDAEIGHTSLINTTNKQILDTVTEFYILSNSQTIYVASFSGFSIMASKFNGIDCKSIHDYKKLIF